VNRTNPHAASVRHLIDSAHRAQQAGLMIAADRYLHNAAEILEGRRVPNAQAYRDQIAAMQQPPAADAAQGSAPHPTRKTKPMPQADTYEELLAVVLNHGTHKHDRTGTGTRSLFGQQLRYDLADGFPLITTKRVHFKSVVGELLWFLSGSTNAHELREGYGVTIWDEWADEDGELGPIYGHQWRSWSTREGWRIDQIAALIDSLRHAPDSRRHIVSAWNPADVPEMALPPCHVLFQFHVADGRLSCQLYQRSADLFLGLPFNIASYALLTHMVAAQTGYDVGEFIWSGGDCHIYNNHVDQVRTQIGRDPYPFPRLELAAAPSIFDYTPDHVTVHNYRHHPAITAPVAV